jgi:hypothetical protein
LTSVWIPDLYDDFVWIVCEFLEDSKIWDERMAGRITQQKDRQGGCLVKVDG